MKTVWILVITTFQGGINESEHIQQFVVPHQYESKKNCEAAGKAILYADMENEFRVFDYVPRSPNGPKYSGSAGVNTDCFPILVE